MNDTLDLIYKTITQKNATCTILILGMAMNGSVGNIHKNDTLLSMSSLDPLPEFPWIFLEKIPVATRFHAVELGPPG
jgi:hypothetical protein